MPKRLNPNPIHLLLPITQILEFKVDSNGTVDPASANIFSETIKGEPKPGTPEVFVFDALGVGTDCTFYFVLTNDPHSTPASVEVYRYNPLQDTDGTPKVVQRAMPMNSPVTGNVVAGAVAPNGDYYFGYYSRNTAADTSGAQGERLRFHLYRYVYQSGHDPDSIVQPIDRSGEVAHVDIEVPEEFMENASFGALFGDLVFNASGDLVLFSSYENPGF